jgi:heme oxygenase
VCALDAVRNATVERHRRLESLPSQARLMAQGDDLADYGSTLLRLLGFHAPLAASFALAAPAVFAGIGLGQRVEALRHDLLDLGFTSADLAAAPLCASLPSLETLDRALGCAYVIVGSSLGGRVIFKRLSALAGTIPLRFFAGDGEHTASGWKRFCARLNAEVESVDQACAGACETFDALTAWLDEPALATAAPKPA